jgi:DNA-binding NarL/FixJ family response regulator
LPGKGKIIFIVGEENSEVHELKEPLGKGGFEIMTSYEAMALVNTARTHDVDLIILDMDMPGKSSQNLIKSMQVETKHKKIPIIAVIDKSSSSLVFNFLQYEPNVRESFVKPLNLRLLVNTVNNLLGTDISITLDTAKVVKVQKRSAKDFEGSTLPTYDNIRKNIRLLTSMKVEVLDPYTRNFLCVGKVIDFAFGGVGVTSDFSLDGNIGVLLRFIISNKELRVPGVIVHKSTFRYEEDKTNFKYGIKYSIADTEEKTLLENILKKLSKKYMKDINSL